ncbi:putative E3 ubiquitin-protein ligase [Sesbania bispinosa]|nr:putative E3 ubiquitin-protein ligase [Sesbania bispinosa]
MEVMIGLLGGCWHGIRDWNWGILEFEIGEWLAGCAGLVGEGFGCVDCGIDLGKEGSYGFVLAGCGVYGIGLDE